MPPSLKQLSKDKRNQIALPLLRGLEMNYILFLASSLGANM
jgi:hypothetical protein